MSFAPGDEVVCISDDWSLKDGPIKFPVKGRHYTVRTVDMFELGEGLRFNEITNPPMQFKNFHGEGAFGSEYFRPVKRESIELFRKMCTSTKPLVEV